MTEEIKKAIDNDPETINRAGSDKDEITDKDLEKAAGGWGIHPDHP
jgi:hypothetical protein